MCMVRIHHPTSNAHRWTSQVSVGGYWHNYGEPRWNEDLARALSWGLSMMNRL